MLLPQLASYSYWVIFVLVLIFWELKKNHAVGIS